ncbi:hypothetical protein [Photobacterium toruni]|uniref:Uncharacterized protein n=1 Tax=Photobacterium toruni TaxID=1935446 RepID=A0A1T4USR7_9GAMM|nr:hypothetical protein [Photobacterium toruni]SKA55678.1 hypothetical protein CZ814_03647 [Photobacterium toruni]
MSSDKSAIEIIEETIQEKHTPSPSKTIEGVASKKNDSEHHQQKNNTGSDKNLFFVLVKYASMAIFMVLMLIIYNMYFDNDTNEQTKIVIMDINENTQHVISQGGDENAIIRYNNFVSNLLSDRGFIVLDRASILGPVPAEYLAPLFDLSVITPTSSTYKPRRPITTLTQK